MELTEGGFGRAGRTVPADVAGAILAAVLGVEYEQARFALALDGEQDVGPLGEEARAGGEARVVGHRHGQAVALERDPMPSPAPQQKTDTPVLGSKEIVRSNRLLQRLRNRADDGEVGPHLVQEPQVVCRVRDDTVGEAETERKRAAGSVSLSVPRCCQQPLRRDRHRARGRLGQRSEAKESGEAGLGVGQIGEHARAAWRVRAANLLGVEGRETLTRSSQPHVEPAVLRRVEGQAGATFGDTGTHGETGTQRLHRSGSAPLPDGLSKRSVGPQHALGTHHLRFTRQVGTRSRGDVVESGFERGEGPPHEREPCRLTGRRRRFHRRRCRGAEVIEGEPGEGLVHVGPHRFDVSPRCLGRTYVHVECDLIRTADGDDERAPPDLPAEIDGPGDDAPTLFSRQCGGHERVGVPHLDRAVATHGEEPIRGLLGQTERGDGRGGLAFHFDCERGPLTVSPDGQSTGWSRTVRGSRRTAPGQPYTIGRDRE